MVPQLIFISRFFNTHTEGVAKAWISNLCEPDKTATAVGTYTAFQSIAALLASSIAGLLWFSFGPAITFLSSSVVAIFVAGLILKIKPVVKLHENNTKD